MAPVIRIPDNIFKKLQNHAVPFEDTPASVISKLLDFYDSHPVTQSGSNDVKKETAKQMLPEKPALSQITMAAVKSLGLTPIVTVDPTHSRITNARIGDVAATDWEDLYRLAHRKAFASLGSLDALQKQVSWEVPKGRRRGKGFEYGYIEELGFSVRSVDAKTSWKRSRELAELCKVPIVVTAVGANNEQINLEWAPSEAS
ncbi:MAG: hypothetical protein NT042_03395 [Sulfuritalea sp.]|nr:hypothetical protein [Sulfuritalea sp.]